MKKALILTYYWPPAGGAGVQRWLKFVKYMREFGWEPVVYTAANGEMPVADASLEKDIPQGITVLKRKIWEPYSIYKLFSGRKKNEGINAAFLSEHKKSGIADKLSVWIRGNLFIPDARRFWIGPSTRYLAAWLEKHPVDCIVSTGPPHSMHLIAMNLKKRFPAIKWLADFRDPWTNIDYYSQLMLSAAADRKHRRLEKKVLMNADAVLSIGESMSGEFRELYREAGGKDVSKFSVITNGFDEEDLSREPVTPGEKFSIAHVGTLVRDRNSPELWKVLAGLVERMPGFARDLEIRLVGKVDIHVKEDIGQHGLTSYVKYISYLPHAEVIAEQRRSKVLLLLVNRTANSKGILTGKFFEYLASGRPLLVIGPPDGDLAAILRRTNAGLISDFGDTGTLEANILALYSGHAPEANKDEVSRYSRRALTRQLCSLMNSL